MIIKDITSYLESFAPLSYQESYDNAGLIVGNSNSKASGILFCLDALEEVVDEAIQLGCNLIVAHHPIVFKGIKRLNGDSYIERVVIKAIKNDIAIYAIHTNLDNIYACGVNTKIAEKLELINTRILLPKNEMQRVDIRLSEAQSNAIQKAIQDINAEIRTENTVITGSSKVLFSIIFPKGVSSRVLAVLKESSSNVPFEQYDLVNQSTTVGAGMIGELAEEVDELDFLRSLKKAMNTDCIRHTEPLNRPIKTVAVCGGSGSFLLPAAIALKADIYITGDFKYHEFFDADGQILIADIGHYESEQFTVELLHDIIAEKFPTFALHLTKVITNPVRYL